MKRLLFSLVSLLAIGGWLTGAKAAWEIKGEPISTVPALLERLQANGGSGLFVIECRAEAAYYGYYYNAFGKNEQYDFINANQVIEIIDAKSTGSVTGAPQVLLRSNFNGQYWGATAPKAADSDEGGFSYSESDAIRLDLLQASVYGKTDADGNNYEEGYDALVFCGDAVAEGMTTGNYDNWSFLANYSSSGMGYWVGANTTKCNQFYVYEVENVNNPLQDLTVLYQEYEKKQGAYLPGEGLGYCDAAAVEAFGKAMEAAQDVLADLGSTEDDYKQAGDRIRETFDAMKASLRMPEDGHYYYVLSAYPAFETQQKVKKGWYKDASAVKWKSLDKDNISFLFKFIKQKDGTFAIMCMKDDTYLSGYTTTSATITMTQSIWPTGEGAFYIKNGPGETSGGIDVYHAQSHSSGAGVSGALTDWYAASNASSASSWVFEELTDLSKIDEMRAVEAQRVLTENFKSELSSARADSAAGYVTAIHNVITSADQLSTNAQEPSEGPIANLLDGNTETFFHTSWSVESDPVHYLQVALNEPLQNISLYWYKRGGNNNNRPARVTILGSNDGVQFDSIMVIEDGLPSAADKPSYMSPVFDLGKAYSHLRFRVDSTNTKTKFFTMSEFAITKDGFPIDEVKSMGLREDMKAAYAELKAAIDAAMAKDPATVTQADIDALKAARKVLADVYPDTTLLTAAIAKSVGYTENILVAEPGQEGMGMCTDASKADALKAAAAAARAALDAKPAMTRAEIEAQIATLQAADKEFLKTIIMPEYNKWYFMQSLCTTREDGTYGSLVAPKENSAGSQIGWGGSYDVDGLVKTKYLWRFLPVEGKEDVFTVQNMGTGYYMGEDRGRSTAFLLSDTAVEFKFVYVSGGQLSLIQNKEGAYMTHAQAAGTVLVPWDSDANSPSAWTFIAGDAESQISEAVMPNGGAEIFCLPYDVTGEFYGYNYDAGIDEVEVTAYTITDARYDENQNITEIGISALDVTDGISAGTPFILVAGELAADNTGDTINVDLGLVYDSEISTQAKEANGLIGLMNNLTVEQQGLGFFSLNGLESYNAEEMGNVVIGGQHGYIDGHKVVASGEAEIYIPVKNGVITEIKQAVKDSKAIVNVYTVDGKLVRKNVKNADALKGLQKGLYVVNGKVYSVK